jgi:hypothetical protein
LLAAIRRVSSYVRGNNNDFIEKVRAVSVLHAENSVKDSKKLLAKSKRRVDELSGLIKKLYGDVTGKIECVSIGKEKSTTRGVKCVKLRGARDTGGRNAVAKRIIPRS